MTARPTALDLPRADADWVAWFAQVRTELEDTARRTVQRLRTGDYAGTEGLVALLDELHEALHSWGGLASTLARAHPRAEVRQTAEGSLGALSEIVEELYQDPRMHLRVHEASRTGLGPETSRVLDLELVEFRRRGAHVAAENPDRLVGLARREHDLGLAYERTLQDRAHHEVHLELLRDVPVDALTGLTRTGTSVQLPLDPRRLAPFLTHVEDRSVRLELSQLAAGRGWPENQSILAELLEVRHERARLLGHPHAAEMMLVGNLLEQATQVETFLERISAGLRPLVEEERRILLARVRQDDPEAAVLAPADLAFHADRTGPESVDAGRIPTGRAVEILQSATGERLGLTWVPVSTPTWAPTVTVYDVSDRDGVRGRVHLDLAPRPGKFERPVHMALQPGAHGRRLPQSALVCSFPDTLAREELDVLAHELGHLLHHLLGSDQAHVSLNGLAVEPDFVEVPAMLVQRWASALVGDPTWPISSQASSPDTATAGTGFAAIETARQVHLAALSLALHVEPDIARAVDRTRHHSPWPEEHDRLVPTTFGHLVSMGAGYYTYLLSQALDEALASALSTTDNADQLAVLHDHVLAVGGRRSAADTVAAITGREVEHEFLADALVDAVFRRSVGSPPVQRQR